MAEIGLGEMGGSNGVEDVGFEFRVLVWWGDDEFFGIFEVHFPFVEGFAEDDEGWGAGLWVGVRWKRFLPEPLSGVEVFERNGPDVEEGDGGRGCDLFEEGGGARGVVEGYRTFLCLEGIKD